MSPCYSDKNTVCESIESVDLYENVYAVSRDYDEYWASDGRFRHIGLYDGQSRKAIAAGNYYYYLSDIPDNYKFTLTGHGLRQSDKDRAIHIDLSSIGDGIPIFAGYVDSHMGHFFVEVLSRGIDYSAYKNHPFVFLLLRNRANLEVFVEYCKFFGLDEKQIAIVRTPVIIPKLYVPRPQFFITQERITRAENTGYIYQRKNLSSRHVPQEYFSDSFLEIHRIKGDQITSEENTVDRILYLSCVKSKKYFGEEIIHRALKANGHTVIYPEDHSWESVISLVRKHTHIVGLRGSAMHFLMFCRKSKKVTYYDHHKALHHNFYNLDQMMDHNTEHVQVRVDGVLNNPETRNLFCYSDITSLLRKLGIHYLPNHYFDYYSNVVIPKHMDYWRSKSANASV